ncbi:trypco2 family protein [Agromyces sp. NPDC004153]
MGDDQIGVGVAEAIRVLRAELDEALDAGEGERVRFRSDAIELTLDVAVTKDVNGKIGWQIVGVGGSYEQRRSQTLKLTLMPLVRGQEGVFGEALLGGE